MEFNQQQEQQQQQQQQQQEFTWFILCKSVQAGVTLDFPWFMEDASIARWLYAPIWYNSGRPHCKNQITREDRCSWIGHFVHDCADLISFGSLFVPCGRSQKENQQEIRWLYWSNMIDIDRSHPLLVHYAKLRALRWACPDSSCKKK